MQTINLFTLQYPATNILKFAFGLVGIYKMRISVLSADLNTLQGRIYIALIKHEFKSSSVCVWSILNLDKSGFDFDLLFSYRIEHEKLHAKHKGHEAMHMEMVLILFATLIVAQIVLVKWKKYHHRSYQVLHHLKY